MTILLRMPWVPLSVVEPLCDHICKIMNSKKLAEDRELNKSLHEEVNSCINYVKKRMTNDPKTNWNDLLLENCGEYIDSTTNSVERSGLN